MAVLTPPDGAKLDTIPAGRYGVQVDISTTSTPQWIFVNGLTNFEPTFKTKLEDDTDITSDGWDSSAVAGNSFSVSFEGLVKGETDTEFTPDPGMQFLVAASQQTGSDAHVHMRYWRTDEVDQAHDFYAAVDASLKGGKPNELQKFSGSLTGRGKPSEITKPGAELILHYGFGATAFVANVDAQSTSSVLTSANNTAIKAAFEALSNVDLATVTGSAPDISVVLVPIPTTTSATGTGGSVTFN